MNNDPDQMEYILKNWERDLIYITRRAMAPLIRFAGALAVKVHQDDMRVLLAWTGDKTHTTERRLDNMVERGAKSVEELIDLNAHLGRPFLASFFAAAQEGTLQKNVFAAASISEASKSAAEQAIRALEERAGEEDFASLWAFQVINEHAWSRILSNSTYAAMCMARSKLNRIEGCESFTLRELICSEQVMDMFAFMVSIEWLTSGDAMDAGARTSRRGANTKYFNVNKYRDLLGNMSYTCNIWFEAVVARPHPLVGDKRVPGMYEPAMPKRELVHNDHLYRK